MTHLSDKKMVIPVFFAAGEAHDNRFIPSYRSWKHGFVHICACCSAKWQ